MAGSRCTVLLQVALLKKYSEAKLTTIVLFLQEQSKRRESPNQEGSRAKHLRLSTSSASRSLEFVEHEVERCHQRFIRSAGRLDCINFRLRGDMRRRVGVA